MQQYVMGGCGAHICVSIFPFLLFSFSIIKFKIVSCRTTTYIIVRGERGKERILRHYIYALGICSIIGGTLLLPTLYYKVCIIFSSLNSHFYTP